MDKFLTKKGYILDKSKLNKGELSKIKRELTARPFQIKGYGMPQKPYKIFIENDKYISVPRAWGQERYGKPNMSKFNEGEDIDLEYNGSLRPLQIKAVEECMKRFEGTGGGILSLYTGCGKTNVAIYLITELKKKTLFIVDQTNLMIQVRDRILGYENDEGKKVPGLIPDAKIGYIQGKKFDIEGKDIVIGMLQSLSLKDYPKNAFNSFGLVIIDECHTVCSRQFSKALFKTTSKYMLGLTATPDRKDRLFKVLEWHIGGIMFHKEQPVILDVTPIVQRYFIVSNELLYNEPLTNYRGKADVVKMLTNIVDYFYRTKIILSKIDELIEDDRKILLLTERIGHAREIYKHVKKMGICTVGLYVGGMKEADRQESARQDLIIGTYKMASKGMDVPGLDALIFATPKNDIRQSIGRVFRKEVMERPVIIVDYIDDFSSFRNQANVRKRLYRSRKYMIEDYNVQDKTGEISEKVVKKKKKNVCLFS